MLKKVVFLATAWGSRYGGLNTVNSELCIALTQLLAPPFQVVCVVLEASEEEIRSAGSVGIRLVPIGRSEHHDHFEPSRAYEAYSAAKESEREEIVWWIGHDVITGHVAIEARKISKQGKVAIFHHTNYFAYAAIKHQDGSKALTRKQEQIGLFREADIVFAIGPKLAGNARSALDGQEGSRVVELIPGFPEVHPHAHPDRFTALTFGRMSKSDDIVKQGRLAVAAFSKAASENADILGSDASIIVLGVPASELAEAQKSCLELSQKYAGRIINAVVTPYIENRKSLLGTLAGASVCLMLSFHEGFGLTGWEAIAAEVPLIVSKNSGLFDFITRELGGSGTGCLIALDIKGAIGGEENFSEEDLEQVADSIRHVKLNLEKAKADAKRLRNSLGNKFTWNSMASLFVKSCGLIGDIVDAGQPAEYMEALQSGQIEQIVPERSHHFDEMWQQLEKDSTRLILFGGISSSLCNEKAARKFATWLIRVPDARLFVCFESGEGARLRAATLDEAALDSSGGLSTKAIERMEQKEKKVLDLRGRLADFVSESILKRVHFIPLAGVITNYLMITDSSIFWAPVLHRRSSTVMSIKVSQKRSQLREQLFGFVLFHLSLLGASDSAAMLKKEIERVEVDDEQG